MQRSPFLCATAVAVLILMLLCLPASGAVTIILVRHAEKAQAPANDPSLSNAGRRRGQQLAFTLADAAVNAIYVSEYRRTRETAEALAYRLQVSPEEIKASDTASLVALIRQHQTGSVLVVGHSDTLPAIISALGGPVVQIAEKQFDNLFFLTLAPNLVSFARLHYGAPAASALVASHPARARTMLEGRRSIMQIKFVRSGGFAGAATRVEGIVNFDDKGAHVVSDANYRHELAPDEAEQLRVAADLSQAPRAAASEALGPERDAYQYDVSVVTSDGKTHKITLSSGSGNSGASAPAALVTWIQDESKKIWAHRTDNR